MGRIGSIFKELRRRLMFRVVALYIVGAWVVLQVADLAFETWGIPQYALRYVWIGALLVFPAALLFGWRYNLTPQGIVRTQPLDPGQVVDLSLRRVDYAIITVLVLTVGAIAFGLIEEILGTEREQTAFKIRDVPEESIAV
ncbi:MAG: hypothetical protein OEQ74_03975, partial [Gammaproteobacteria bacterium]|nr:hypothetical protein [Gammaproteobacteria bacterium]